MMNDWQKAWERFLEDCEHAVEISRGNLRRLMEDNKDTEYGRLKRLSDGAAGFGDGDHSLRSLFPGAL